MTGRDPWNVYWVATEASLEVLMMIMAILCPNTQLIVIDLISLVRHKSRYIWVHLDWAEEYDMMQIDFIYYLSLDLNMCCIGVE